MFAKVVTWRHQFDDQFGVGDVAAPGFASADFPAPIRVGAGDAVRVEDPRGHAGENDDKQRQ